MYVCRKNRGWYNIVKSIYATTEEKKEKKNCLKKKNLFSLIFLVEGNGFFFIFKKTSWFFTFMYLFYVDEHNGIELCMYTVDNIISSEEEEKVSNVSKVLYANTGNNKIC